MRTVGQNLSAAVDSEVIMPVTKWSISLGLFLVASLTLTAANPLWAHAKLVESIPAGGDVLAKPPEQVSLRFDEPVHFEETEGAGVDLLDPIKVYNEEGERVDEGNTRASSDDPKVLLVDLKKLPDGVYGVDWDVTSKDGHVIDGSLGFTVERSHMSSESAADTKAKRDEGALGTILAASVMILALVSLAFFGVLRRR
jgi:methionine-rich copper-binding protein CopC